MGKTTEITALKTVLSQLILRGHIVALASQAIARNACLSERRAQTRTGRKASRVRLPSRVQPQPPRWLSAAVHYVWGRPGGVFPMSL